MAEKLDFAARVAHANPDALAASGIDTVMLNIGRRCDLECAHCHHSCSPTSTEEMPRDILAAALKLAGAIGDVTVDITGGSPELWPLLRECVARAREDGHAVRLRTNLVAMDADPELPPFLAENGVSLVASLPGIVPHAVREQRGRGVYRRSISRLRDLAALGYGDGTADGGPLPLDIAVNPQAGELPCSERLLERRYRGVLEPVGVRFRRVLALPNVPLGRLAEALDRDGRSAAYLHRLADGFNAATLGALHCRRTVDIAWDGRLYDCDYNLAARLSPVGPKTVHEALADPSALLHRPIAFGPHCFACTADAGSG